LDDQWTDEFHEFMPHAKVGHFGGGKNETQNCNVVMATIQTLVSKWKTWPRDKLFEWFNEYALIVIDEAHHMAAKQYSSLFEFIPYERLLSLSATPTRRDGLTCLLKWYLHETLYRVVRPKAPSFNVKFLFYHEGIQKEHRIQEGCFEGLFDNDKMEQDLMYDWKRNSYIITIVLNMMRQRMRNPHAMSSEVQKNRFESLPRTVHDRIASYLSVDETRSVMSNVDRHCRAMYNRRQVIVFVKRRDHAFILKKMLRHFSNGMYSCSHMLGKMKTDAREAAKKCNVLFASVAMVNEAFNLPTLDSGVLGTPQSEMEQLVGRLMRKSKLKFSEQLFDIVDAFGMFTRRGEWRRYQYADEFGFTCSYQHLAARREDAPNTETAP
jgi:superfamily II DNA or RNA helicase